MATSGVDISNHPDIGGLFHCAKDFNVCVTTMFCPCLTYGLAMNELIPPEFQSENKTCEFATRCFFLCPILPIISSQNAFDTKNMKGLCTWWCCNPCFLCKLRRTSKFIKKFMADVVENIKANQVNSGEQTTTEDTAGGAPTAEAIDVNFFVDVNVNMSTHTDSPPLPVDCIR